MDNAGEIYFTPYKTSTITCNANIGKNINIDLSILFNNIEINENKYESIIWIQNLKGDNQYSRGIYPKKIRKSKKNKNKKNRFDNQVTIIYRITDIYMPNIKIFKNGNVQLTGLKKIEDTKKIVDKIIENVKNIYINIDKNINTNKEEDYNILENLEYCNLCVRLINTDFKTYTRPDEVEKFNIRRKELHHLLISDKYNNKSSFQPGIYQGVKLEYYYNDNNNGICSCVFHNYSKNKSWLENNCKKITIAIFESGSILITGGVTFEQVDKAYNYITKIISDNMQLIRRPVFVYEKKI